MNSLFRLEHPVEQKQKVIALGFFDGVHRGHGALLQRVVLRARELNAIPATLTFDAHPLSVIVGNPSPLINTIQDRVGLIRRRYGIECVEIAHFDQSLMHQPWHDFITEYLVDRLHACHVVCGHDFHFGYRGEGNPQRLKEACAALGIGCDVIEKVEQEGITVSSTYIRRLLAEGNMTRAISYLGHPHVLTGSVVHGKGLGRTIGIPTANLLPPEGLVSLARGVYATRVILPDGQTRLAVTNVGVQPTVVNGNRVVVEPWILDYDGDLYNREIRLEFYHHLRGERKFSGIRELKEEILHNAQQTRALLSQLRDENPLTNCNEPENGLSQL